MKRLAICTVCLVPILLTGCVPLAQSAAPVIQAASQSGKLESLQVETDGYVAKTYPDFDVLQTKGVRDIANTGQPGIWYVLQRKSQPGFVMAVLVMKPEEIDKKIAALKLERDVDFFTSDGAFRRLAGSDDSLSPADLDQITDLYLAQKPSKDALIVGTLGEPDFVFLYVVEHPSRTTDGEYQFPMTPTLLGSAAVEFREDIEDLSPLEWSLEFEELSAP